MASRKSTSLFAGLFILALTWRARAQVEVNMEDRVEVFRGDTAQITCMFTSSEGIGGIEIQWFLMLGETKQRIYYRDSTMEQVEAGTGLAERISVNVAGTAGADREVLLTIRDVQLEDEKTFICQIRTLDGAQEGRTRLRVFETPQLPSINGEDTGISVTKTERSKIASCEVRNGYPQPNITWYRDLTPLRSTDGDAKIQTVVTTQSTGLFTVNSELLLKVVKEDQDARFYCEVSYYVPGGTKMTETPRINITVHYPITAVDIWVESPTGLVKEGDTVDIRCRGNGNPQPDLTFTFNEEELQKSEGHVGRVELRDVTRLNTGKYHCSGYDQETFVDEFTNEAELFVHYLDPAVLDPKDTTVMQLGEEKSVTCNALSSLTTHTSWYKDGELVAEGHVLKLTAGLATSGTYECVVTAPALVGLETRGELRVYVQAPPVLSEPAESLLEESVDQSVELRCHATGYPAPTLSWTSSDSQALKEVSGGQEDGGVTSVVRVKVTSDLTVHCTASSPQGTVAKVFTIKAKGSGVIIAVIIICILLLAILGSVLYFLYKKGKICGRSGKQDLTKEKSSKDNIVVEMKSDNTEDVVLLQGINGEKKPPNDQ